jgi:hypothetical protein
MRESLSATGSVPWLVSRGDQPPWCVQDTGILGGQTFGAKSRTVLPGPWVTWAVGHFIMSPTHHSLSHGL